MIPGFEGRIAIPFAMSAQILGDCILSPAWAFFCSLIGSIIPSIPLILLTKKLKNKFFTGFIVEKYSSKIKALSTKNSNIKKLILLSLFVAIPLPMTGVWSGSIIAGLTDLKPYQSFIAIFIGSLIACSIILLVCIIFNNSTLIILLIALFMILTVIIFEIIRIIFNNIRKRKRLK